MWSRQGSTNIFDFYWNPTNHHNVGDVALSASKQRSWSQVVLMFISRCLKDHFWSPFASISISGIDVAVSTSQWRSSSQVVIHNADVYHVHYVFVCYEFLQPSEDHNLNYKKRKRKRRKEKHVTIHNADDIMSIMSVMSFCNHPWAIIEITKLLQTKAASKI